MILINLSVIKPVIIKKEELEFIPTNKQFKSELKSKVFGV